MGDEFTGVVDGEEVTVDLEDIQEAFRRTEESYDEYRYSPWNYIAIDGEKKPIKDVFKNIEDLQGLDIDKSDFTTNVARRFVENLDVQTYNVRENSTKLFIETLREIFSRYDGIQPGDSIDSNERAYKLIEEKAPSLLKHLVIKETEFWEKNLDTDSSAGQGLWSTIPWISLEDKEDRTLEYGTNPVFLLNPKTGKIYLTLNQKVRKEDGNDRTDTELRKKGDELRKKYTLDGFQEGPIELEVGGIGGKYGPATVFYKEYEIGSLESEELENDVAQITNFFIENLEDKKDMDEPKLFLAPCSNDDAYAHLRDTVIRRVPTETVNEFSDRSFDHDVVSVWGNREGTKSSWEKIDEGDFLLFYRQGEYIYGAEIISTERNSELAEELWPDDEGDPWKYIIYLKEPFRMDLSQDEINDLADYSDNYNLMGFQSLNDEGIRNIGLRYGGVREFLQEKKTGPASPETSFIDYHSDEKEVLTEAKEPSYSGGDIDVSKGLQTGILEDLLRDQGLYFPDGQGEEIISQIESALNSGKHIIFTGPPGTGKTEIAEAVASELEDEEDNVTGYQMTTATADWSTFDTVGGFMPEKNSEDGNLEFSAGQVLKRFRKDGSQENEVLVIDEINRSDIDKAFGQLFTLLSGQEIQLPYTAENEEEIEVIPGDEAPERPEEHQYVMPESWRILATMNSYDKTSLYEMSYAFMRRFAFIRVDAPDENLKDHIRNYNNQWNIDAGNDDLDAVAAIWKETNNSVDGRKIGPAIAEDMLSFLAHDSRDLRKKSTDAVVNFVLPQLEGVRKNQKIVENISGLDEYVNGSELKDIARDMLQVKFNEEN
jgi:5-methylcytosine-specific restriction protein B